MRALLALAMLAAYNNDADTIWVTMLVFVILAAGVGLWSFVKRKQAEFNKQKEDYSYYNTTSQSADGKWRWKLQEKGKVETQKKHFTVTPSPQSSSDLEFSSISTAVTVKRTSTGRKGVDLQSGIELLDLDFLVNIVGSIELDDSTDVSMHKLSFEELIRRKQLNRIASRVLKEYALDKDNVYGKSIQCEAIKELAIRTARTSNKVL